MQLVFSDAQYWGDFLPLTFTRPVAELRIGILTFQERWKKLLEIEDIAFLTEDYLQEKFKKPEGKFVDCSKFSPYRKCFGANKKNKTR